MEIIQPYFIISIYVWGVFILLSGGFYLLSSSIFEHKFPNLKIFKKNASKKQIQLEIKNSFISISIINIMFIFVYELYHMNALALNDIIPDFWPIIFTVQFFIMHTLHDAYFYWTHRWMHEIKWMRSWHLAHHKSLVPTPFSAFNFSWQEASIHALFFFLTALIIPIHWAVFSYFYAFLFWINVFGHMNFDFWPQGLYRWPYGSLFMTPTHHSFHHEYNKFNYGLYYRFWDELCKTMNTKTYPHFYHLKKAHRPFYTSQIPEKRPHPNETIGLYFEQVEQFGEDVMINWDVNGERFHYHHSGDDGTSSFHNILKIKKIDCIETPSFSSRPSLSFFKKFKSIIRLYIRIPHTCSVLRKTKSKYSPRQNTSIYFTQEETEKIIQKAKGAGVNAYFIFQLSKIIKPVLNGSKQMWMVPVNTNNPGEIIENEVSNVDIIFDQRKVDALKIKNLVKNEINEGMIYAGKFLFATLNPFGRTFFSFQVWLSQFLIRRTACFSNLGKFQLSEDINISFAPPPQRGCCFSAGLVTINNRFCLRLGLHRQVEMDLEKISKELKTNLLSI